MSENGTQPRDRAVLTRGFWIILGYVRAEPVTFGIAVFSAALYAAGTVSSAFVLGRVTDNVLVPAFHGGVPGRTVALGVGAIMGVALVRALGIVFRRFFAGMTSARVGRRLRRRIVDHYRELPLAFHRSTPTGELVAHAESDVLAATDVLHPLPYSTAVVLLVVFAAVSLIVTDPFLAVIGCSVLPILAFLNRAFSSKVEPGWTAAQEQVGRVASVAHESIDGALVVKTLGREAAEVERFAREADRLRQVRIQVGRLRAGFEPAFDALPTLGNIILLAVGSWRISTGNITTGTLVQFVSLFQLLAFPIRLLGFLLSDVPRAVVARERLEGVFLTPVRRRHDAAGAGLDDRPPRLSVRDLGFAFGAHTVLHDVDFEMAPGETVALVGATGAGKSTLIDLIVGLEDPAVGVISLDGLPVDTILPSVLRSTVSVVFQESFLFADTVRSNIVLDRDASDDEVSRASRLAQAHDFISELPQGYQTVLGERGVTLSGGQRQRVALARALVRKPRLLLLDDATSAVDPTVEAAILAGLRRDLRSTTLIVAHRMSTIALADRVLFMDGGSIAATGTHRELLSVPAYEALVMAYETEEATG